MFCIMITGKDKCREHMAKQSVVNFLEQDYQDKTLVILNHSADYVVKTQQDHLENVYEFYIDKDSDKDPLTLGDMRNIGLAMVPPNAVWTTWDDDDYRKPTYLSTMMRAMQSANADVLCFTKRLEYNTNTGLVWGMSLDTGFPLVFAKQDMRILYEKLDKMEDTNLISRAKELGLKVKIYKNDPHLYVRMVHTNNTSLYVNPAKSSIQSGSKSSPYREYNIDDVTRNCVNTFMSTYFKKGIECHG